MVPHRVAMAQQQFAHALPSTIPFLRLHNLAKPVRAARQQAQDTPMPATVTNPQLYVHSVSHEMVGMSDCDSVSNVPEVW